MNVHTTARHCELDPEVRTHTQQRLERLTHYLRHPDDLMEAHVVFAAEKYRHSAEVTLKIRHLGEVFSREEAGDPRAAIDLAAERLEHQILRAKERRVERRHAGGLRALNGAEANGEADADADADAGGSAEAPDEPSDGADRFTDEE
ncbi:MAG: ribosome-associated translation inhibitor RaiA [Candidatus Eisenbacteria bacterium]|uniref:Ribosome-associated translation inhibitor RaiA n=1 Tax=Eiseniibacteriota bacterium TaxID=2212470 RepID=A0A9D6QMW4_UNCEI|nr:ribosome-associated translation inhibitor RaiA [Candidatus Eisenbacteria bacterium]MBI3540173.1 ribosome-associated translation inhibitor RaiA [Candidatus Eisenbacteria bacterium]